MKIFRSTLIKKILWVVIIMWLSWVFLNGHVGVTEQVHAQSQIGSWSSAASTSTNDTMSMWQILNIVLKIIYLLLWPLLVIAGLALDNTLVYASIFHLDAPLWQFWNMMKNFANFALWFMVLFAIIKSIFTNSWAGSAKDEKSPLGIIKVTLIAGILIQASWFIVAALVDISTIATYAVGWLPLSVLKGTEIGNQRILPVSSSIDLNKFNLSFAGGEEFKVWYSLTHSWINLPNQNVNISPCRISRSYVIGREFGDTGFNNFTQLNATDKFKGMEVCALNGNQLVMRPEKALFTILQTTYACTGCTADTPAGYTAWMTTIMGITWWDANPNITQHLVSINSGTAAYLTWDLFFNGSNALTISSIIQKSKWFVGPLVTIYSSLLHFTQLTSANITSVSGTSWIFIIKSLVAVALFFPLIALALVLIARIGVLWLYIVASPFIILKESFKIKMWGLDNYLSVKSVLWIIFAPVITVAALSISLIFMTALVDWFDSQNNTTVIDQVLGIEKLGDAKLGNDAVSFWWMAQLEFSKLDWWWTMDWFSWLMINFFAIGLMWMIFFAALKSNELGKSVGGKVEDIWTNVFKTLPILPIGTEGKWVGIGSAAKVVSNIPNDYINRLTTSQESQVKTWMDDKTGSGSTSSSTNTFTAETAKPIVEKLTKVTNETEAKAVYTDLWTTINNNTESFYRAINNIEKEEDREKALNGIKLVNTEAYTSLMKMDFDKKIGDQITKDTKDNKTITELLNKNKKLVDDYFKINKNKEFIKEVDDWSGKKITFTITPKANTKNPEIIEYIPTISWPK